MGKAKGKSSNSPKSYSGVRRSSARPNKGLCQRLNSTSPHPNLQRPLYPIHWTVKV